MEHFPHCLMVRWKSWMVFFHTAFTHICLNRWVRLEICPASGKSKSWKTTSRGWTYWHTRKAEKSKSIVPLEDSLHVKTLCYVNHHPGNFTDKFHRHSSPSLHSGLPSPALNWWPSGFCTLSCIFLTKSAAFHRIGKGWSYHTYVLETREVK